jgi:hypothetical protein
LTALIILEPGSEVVGLESGRNKYKTSGVFPLNYQKSERCFYRR